MPGIPEDPEGRREWLETWAAEQQRRIDRRNAPASQQLRLAVRKAWVPAAIAATHYGRMVLDRGMNTQSEARLPLHDDPELVQYVPTAWHVVPRALHAIGASREDTFVDFGCGKGRVVHQAACRPLRRVIGVEISAAFAEQARAAVAARRHQHRCLDVEIVTCDATRFTVPDDMTIAYMFDPFRGTTFDAVIRRIIESIDRLPRCVRLIYVHPVRGASVVATGRFRLVGEQRGGLRNVRINRAALFASC